MSTNEEVHILIARLRSELAAAQQGATGLEAALRQCAVAVQWLLDDCETSDMREAAEKALAAADFAIHARDGK